MVFKFLLVLVYYRDYCIIFELFFLLILILFVVGILGVSGKVRFLCFIMLLIFSKFNKKKENLRLCEEILIFDLLVF